MTEDEVRSKVDVMVDRIRLVWAVLVVGALVGFFASDLAWWALPLLLVGCVVAYNLHLSIAASILIRQVVEEGVEWSSTSEIEVTATSTSTVGRYFDFNVPEWIEVSLGNDTQRYDFKDFAPAVEGGFTIPSEGDYILYSGAIYQPARDQGSVSAL